MRELALGARLTLAGGRTGLARTLITALGVGLGVAALLLAASLPTIHQRPAGPRRHARTAIEGSGALLVGDTLTEFQGRDVHGQLLQAERAGAPVPPGLTRLPRPGELFVSPALRELLDTPRGQRVLAPRLPGRVVGEVGAGRAARTGTSSASTRVRATSWRVGRCSGSNASARPSPGRRWIRRWSCSW